MMEDQGVILAIVAVILAIVAAEEELRRERRLACQRIRYAKLDREQRRERRLGWRRIFAEMGKVSICNNLHTWITPFSILLILT